MTDGVPNIANVRMTRPQHRAPPDMPLLPARHYVSDHTRFINALLEKKPQLEADQRVGRAIFWDKLPSEVQAERERDQGRVPQKAYVYSSG